MMKKLYFTLAVFLTIIIVCSVHAQTTIMYEDFASGIPGTWTNVVNTGGTTGQLFEYTTVGLFDELNSTTAANGYVMFDSDGYGSGAPNNTSLTTASFNCSGQSNVKLYFEDFFRQYASSIGTVAVSNNNGTTWNTVYTVGTGLAQDAVTNNPNYNDIDISLYAANQANVKLRFTYTGDYDYWWFFDDIWVYAPSPYDAAVVAGNLSEYTAVPLSQVGSYTPSCDVYNNGLNTVTGVSVQTKIYDGSNAVVFSAAMTQASLASGVTTTLTVSSTFTPTTVDFYLVEFIVDINEADGNINNDTLYWALDVTDSTYARDFGMLVGDNNGVSTVLGIGAGSTAILGNVFDIVNPSTLVSIDAIINASVVPGDTVNAHLYNFSSNVVGSLVASQQIIITAADTPVINISFPFNQTIAAGQYYMAIEETNTVDNLGVWFSDEIYTTNRIIGNLNGGAFNDFETLTGGAFRNVPYVRASLYTPQTIGDCEDLIISEVVEGSSNNKAIELYNPTASPIDLAAGNYFIQIYSNGVTTPNTPVALSGVVPAEGTFVFCNSSANATIQAASDVVGGSMTTATFYNGDDVIELLKGTTTVDIVGQIGSTFGFSTNRTIVRNDTVLKGDTDGTDAFNANAWTVYPQDDASHLGMHYSDCNPVCYISDLAAGTQGACVSSTGLYIQDVVVTFNNAPTSGMLNVNGQTFAIGTSPQTVTLTGLTSNGNAVNVTAFFTADNTCTYTENTVFTSPASCLCPTINVMVNTTDVTNCATPNGSATAVPSGGTGTYTYVWTPSTFGSGATISNLPAGTYSVVATDGDGCSGSGQGSVVNASGVNASITTYNNISCYNANDGEVVATASGGSGTYTYTWSDGLNPNSSSRTNLMPGANQTVVVADGAGCSVTLTFSMTNPTQISIAVADQQDVSCNGLTDGYIDMTVSGGTGTLGYAWDNSALTTADLSNIGANTYQLTVTDANGCQEFSSFITIDEPNALSVSVPNVVDVACYGNSTGSFVATASGGTSPYSYNIGGASQTSGSFSGLTAQTYTVSVTDANNCPVATTTQVISEPTSALVITNDNVQNVSCNGLTDGAIEMTVSGGTSGYTFDWGTGNPATEDLASLGAGTYTLTVTDANNCTATSSAYTVTEPTSISLNTSTTPETASGTNDGTATVEALGGTGQLDYLWNDANGQSNATATGLGAGTYTVTVSDENGCSSTATVEVTVGSGINDLSISDLQIYPNPSSKVVTVSFTTNELSETSISIYNTIGNVLVKESLGVSKSYSKTFDVTTYAAGVYFIEIASENGSSIHKLTVSK